jgi:hypothetical protein
VDEPSEADDERALAAYGAALAQGIDEAIVGWVRAAVAGRAGGRDLDDAAAQAGEEARAEVAAALRALLGTDVDRQATTPLSIVRAAVRHPTRVLAEAGVPPVGRDPIATEAFPDDPYDLTPGSLADLDPELVSAGIAWGAAKAHVVLRRRRGAS